MKKRFLALLAVACAALYLFGKSAALGKGGLSSLSRAFFGALFESETVCRVFGVESAQAREVFSGGSDGAFL